MRHHWMGVLVAGAVGADRVRFNSRSFGSSSMTVLAAVDMSDAAVPETTPRYDSPDAGDCCCCCCCSVDVIAL